MADPLYILIDGDGHEELTEAALAPRLLDLVLSNEQISIKTTKHVLAGESIVLVEIIGE